MCRSAEIAMRSARAGVPDAGRAYAIGAERALLIRDLRIALAKKACFRDIETAFSDFALSLRWVDPLYGVPPGELEITLMQDRGAVLHRAIRNVAAKDISWVLAGHERAK